MITKFLANLVFQAEILSLRFSGNEIYGNAGNFLSRVTGVYLVFEVFPTEVAHLCLPCLHKHAVAHMSGSGYLLPQFLPILFFRRVSRF